MGAVGAGSSLTDKGKIFKAEVTDGEFTFNPDPCPETSKLLAPGVTAQSKSKSRLGLLYLSI